MKKQSALILALVAVAGFAYYYFVARKKSKGPARSAGAGAAGPAGQAAPLSFVSNRGTQAQPAKPSTTDQLTQTGIKAGGDLLSSLLKGLGGGGGGSGSGAGGGGGRSAGGGATSSTGSSPSSSSGGGTQINWTNASAQDLGFDFGAPSAQETPSYSEETSPYANNYTDTSGVYDPGAYAQSQDFSESLSPYADTSGTYDLGAEDVSSYDNYDFGDSYDFGDGG